MNWCERKLNRPVSKIVNRKMNVRSSEWQNPASARASRALAGASPDSSADVYYSKRRLPHFERPWAKYTVAFCAFQRRQLGYQERDLVLDSALYAHEHGQYELYVACVMPDHVHLLFEPQIKGQDADGNTMFWSLTEIMRGIKSSSAHRMNTMRQTRGPVWEKESFDRLIRSEADLREKFRYICRNPVEFGRGPAFRGLSLPVDTRSVFGEGGEDDTRGACAPQPMNWFRENRWLGTFLIVFGICALVALYFLFSARSAFIEASARFNDAAAERTRLEHLNPFPERGEFSCR